MLAAGFVHLLADEHGKVVQRGGYNRQEEEPENGPYPGRKIKLPEVPVRRGGKVEPEEVVIHGDQLVRNVGELVEMCGYELRLVNLGVKRVDPFGQGEALLGKALEQRAALGEQLFRHAHDQGDGPYNRAVEGEQYRERKQAPETAAHRAGLFLAVEFSYFLVQLLLVALVLALQLHELGLQARHAHHALLALGHEGQQHDCDDQRKQDYGHAEVVRQLIELTHQPAKRCCYRIKHVFFSSLGGNAPRQGPPGGRVTARDRRIRAPRSEMGGSGLYASAPASHLSAPRISQ